MSMFVLPAGEDSPAWRGRLNPDAEETQGGFREDRPRHAECRCDQTDAIAFGRCGGR